MARRRYQQGRIFTRGKNDRRVYVGRWREDVVEPDGTTRRVERSVVLGPVAELRTLKNAHRAFEPFLAKVNSVDYRPGKFAKIGDFAKVWEREVLAHKKPSSVKAADRICEPTFARGSVTFAWRSSPRRPSKTS